MGPITEMVVEDWAWIISVNVMGVVRINPSIRKAIDAIEESGWTTIAYPDGGQAQVAECVYVTGRRRHRRELRLVVRRTRLSEPAQRRLWHGPSGRFFANAAWLACAVLAHNLIRWTARLGIVHPAEQLTVARTIRTRLLEFPAGSSTAADNGCCDSRHDGHGRTSSTPRSTGSVRCPC